MSWNTFVAVLIGSIIAACVIVNVPTEPCHEPDWGGTELFEAAMESYESM